MEVDATKLIPNPDTSADKLVFLGTADKQGSAYLKSALTAVIKHFNANPKSPFVELPRKKFEMVFSTGSTQNCRLIKAVLHIKADGQARLIGYVNN